MFCILLSKNTQAVTFTNLYITHGTNIFSHWYLTQKLKNIDLALTNLEQDVVC